MGLALRLVLAAWCLAAQAQDFITVASTTSTEQSGLFRHILPEFTRQTGIEVRVVAAGTGQALDIGRRGDADVVFVHDEAAERAFIAAGHGIGRRRVMYNDFVVVGPRADPARAAGKDIVDGLQRIARSGAPFVSRGDRSGTHAAELRFWKLAGVDPQRARGRWYRETGAGMGPTLNTASGLDAYALSDRGTWLAFRNRGDLALLIEGDRRLFNQYGVMLVNPAKHAHVKKDSGLAFIDWLTSDRGQKTIADHKIGGQPLFFPNAGS